MARIPLIGGSYEARSPIVSAQQVLNLFPEPAPQDAPFPLVHYPASGTVLFWDYGAAGLASGAVRGLYWASTGALIAVVGTDVFQIMGSDITTHRHFGSLPTNSGLPVRMTDNGRFLLMVDGTAGGWTIDLLAWPTTLTAISDPAFYGGNNVDFIDTFFIVNSPGTPTFYVSPSNWDGTSAWDPLYFAEKIGYNDILVTIVALHDNIWLLGNVTSEVWFNSGAPDFPFQRMPNGTIQQGCIAAYSAVVADNALFWLSQDRYGRSVLLRGEGYATKRVSNFAIEHQWATYTKVSDCVGMVYQQAGHEIVLLWFPTGNATWAYDTTTQMWHRRTYGGRTDAWIPSCAAYYGVHGGTAAGETPGYVIAGDRRGPRIYGIDRNAGSDDGTPIERVRAFPHILNDQRRMSHTQFVAAMQPGHTVPDTVSLRWSDDGGQTWGAPVAQTVNGATNGQYSWRRLGLARDRVYELSWTGQAINGQAALNGAWIEAVGAGT